MAGGKDLTTKEADIQMMLSAVVHLGTNNCDFQMERYIFKRREDGVYIINLGKSWEKLQMAARVIAAIENPKDITLQSSRPFAQTAVLKFAHYTGCQTITGRYTPGTFTNQLLTSSFSEPRLLIVADPRTDHQSIKEAAQGNIPTIALCDTDTPMRGVDIGIPANNKGNHSIGCLFWLLARMVLQMRGVIPQGHQWHVMVDLFFYRESEVEAKKQQNEEKYDTDLFFYKKEQEAEAKDQNKDDIDSDVVVVANNMRKLESDVEHMSKLLQGLTTRVKGVEEEWRKIFDENKAEPPSFTSVEEPPQYWGHFDLDNFPPFPLNFRDIREFKDWIEDVDDTFECCELQEDYEVCMVAESLEGDALSAWEKFKHLNMELDKDDPICWISMKKMFLVLFFEEE